LTEVRIDYRNILRVSEVFREIRCETDPDTFSSEFKRILSAIEPEDQFMAIASWSGRCSLIHRLSPEKYPLEADSKYKIPDLFAVFKYKSKDIPVLIEVKSTYTQRLGAIETADFSPSYREKLANYGKLLGLPVLIAQQIKPGAIWFLVDLATVGSGGNAINLEYDLSSLLLGSYSLTFHQGISFVLRMENLTTSTDNDVVGTVTNAHWESSDGTKLEDPKSPMILLFGLGDPVESTKKNSTSFTIRYTIENEISFFNYQALYAAVTASETLAKFELPWVEILHSGHFPLLYPEVEMACQDKGYFKYLVQWKPKTIPEFLDF